MATSRRTEDSALSPQLDFPRWDTDRPACCRSIARDHATLKILLKTKDDAFLLERWIAHHRKIVGDGNIVIFDNMSDNPDVIRLYEKYQDAIRVIRFPGFFDSLHDVSACPELYRALAESADFFIFLDTDEFLVMIDEHRYRNDADLVSFLEDHGGSDVFPATWLPNTDWSAVRFRCGDDLAGLAGGIAWGKPILRSKAGLSGFINHNIQLAHSLFLKPFKMNFFVLHMKSLSPEQRISSNVKKLIARGFAAPGESVDEICRRRLDAMASKSTIRYVGEIRDLVAQLDGKIRAERPLGPGCLELLDDHGIRYYGEKERDLVAGLINDPVSTYLAAILRAKFKLQKENRLPGLASSDCRGNGSTAI